jgi:hypothetical protein
MLTPTPTPMATPWLGAALGVGELVVDVAVGDDEVVVEIRVLWVELVTLAVNVAEGSMVVTGVPAFKEKTTEGSEQLQPPKP